MILAPQLAFQGDCRQAFTFYAALLGGEIRIMNTFGDNADHALPPGSAPQPAHYVRYAEVHFGDGILRGNDVGADQFEPMRGFSISLHCETASEARRFFDGLAEGGNVSTPLTKVDGAELFGMVVDRFAVPWLVLALGK